MERKHSKRTKRVVYWHSGECLHRRKSSMAPGLPPSHNLRSHCLRSMCTVERNIREPLAKVSKRLTKPRLRTCILSCNRSIPDETWVSLSPHEAEPPWARCDHWVRCGIYKNHPRPFSWAWKRGHCRMTFRMRDILRTRGFRCPKPRAKRYEGEQHFREYEEESVALGC
jgi:hypothetical protein